MLLSDDTDISTTTSSSCLVRCSEQHGDRACESTHRRVCCAEAVAILPSQAWVDEFDEDATMSIRDSEVRDAGTLGLTPLPNDLSSCEQPLVHDVCIAECEKRR